MPRAKIVKHVLADGSVKEYRYERPEALRSMGWLINQYELSTDFKRKKPNTQLVYLRAMRLINANWRNVAIDTIRRRHVKGHCDTFSDKPALANQLLSVWGVLLKFAVEQEYIIASPAQRIAKYEMGEHRRWTAEAIEIALTSFPEYMRRAVMVGLYTGQREGDCVKMLWSDYDGQGIFVTQEKTGARLWIPCHPALKAELDEWRKSAPAVTILTRKDGTPWPNAMQFSKAFLKTRRTYATLDEFVFHGLRKAAAATLAEAGCTTHEIAAITGHASLAEVERYTREAEQRRRAEAAMGKLLVFRGDDKNAKKPKKSTA